MTITGVLSADGHSKTFDANADGYARSDLRYILTKGKKRKTNLRYSGLRFKVNCDGYKEQDITFPSSAKQNTLMKDCYEDCNLSPNNLSYLECHGTGTKAGDPEKLKAIQNIFCKDRPTPLLIGSVKSNLGHSEGASGLCQIAKVIFFFLILRYVKTY